MKVLSDHCKIDFHVHSPASSDYQGIRGPRGYASLAHAFVDADVSGIVLTDHNTINGYQEYQRTVKMARDALRIMIERDDSQEFVKELKDEVEAYNRLNVLPGVEISVYPNIHIILIFNPSVVENITYFLRDTLELGDAVDRGDPDVASKHSVLVVLDKAAEQFGDKFFCILPHVESSKGVWKELDRMARADIVKDERVIAIQFSNPDTVQHINQILNNPQYKRKQPLSFIQASDFHGSPNVKPASSYSVLNLTSDLSFTSLRESLGDPSCIRNSWEFVDEQMKHYVKGRKIISFDFNDKLDVSPERETEMEKALCAVLNTPKSILRLNLFNVAETADKGGEIIATLIETLTTKLDPPDPFGFQVVQFHQSSTRQRFCVKPQRNSKLRIFDSLCWIADVDKPRPAKAFEIESVVGGNFYHRYGKINQESLVSASTQILRASNSFPAIPIASRLDSCLCKNKLAYCQARLIRPSYSKDISTVFGVENGYWDSDFFLIRHDLDIKGGRLGKQRDYYRFSAPSFPFKNRSKQETVNTNANSLLVSLGGGVNVINANRPLYAPFPVFEISFVNANDASTEQVKKRILGLAAWLKSSFVLWYITALHQTDDLFDVMLKEKRVPMPIDLSVFEKLGVFANNVYTEEKKLLISISKENPSKEDRKKFSIIIKAHNEAVSKNMRQIDIEVLRSVAVSHDEIEEMYRVLRELNLYDYGISTDFDNFIKEVEQFK